MVEFAERIKKQGVPWFLLPDSCRLLQQDFITELLIFHSKVESLIWVVSVSSPHAQQTGILHSRGDATVTDRAPTMTTSYRQELEKYRDIDEDKLLMELSPEELAQLDLELQEMDPEVRPGKRSGPDVEGWEGRYSHNRSFQLLGKAQMEWMREIE